MMERLERRKIPKKCCGVGREDFFPGRARGVGGELEARAERASCAKERDAKGVLSTPEAHQCGAWILVEVGDLLRSFPVGDGRDVYGENAAGVRPVCAVCIERRVLSSMLAPASSMKDAAICVTAKMRRRDWYCR